MSRAAIIDSLRRLGNTLDNIVSAYTPQCQAIMEQSLFDAEFYRKQKCDGAGSELKLLRHYLIRGFFQGYDPHPLFSTSYYLQNSPDIGGSGMNPFVHYLKYGCKEYRDPHPLFDTSYYLARGAYSSETEGNPLLHYLLVGAKEGRSPHPLFSISYYLQNNSDVAESGINPLIHYLKYGYIEGRDPHPLFDTSYYLTEIAGDEAAGNPLLHYLRVGVKEGKDPHPLFDTSYYLENNPDVAESGINPLIHYLQYGYNEGRDPHPLFDTSYYLAEIAGDEVAGIPLLHYLLVGVKEGRNPHPLFSTSYYLENNPDVAESGINPLIHYLDCGYTEGRDPHPLFDTSYYLAKGEGSAEVKGNPLLHYLLVGVKEKRNPHPLFSASYYLEKNPDVAESGSHPFLHFLKHGYKEKRNPHRLFNTLFYSRKYMDCTGDQDNPLEHFFLHGLAARTDPHPLFNTAYYLQKNPEAITSGLNPLVHFLENSCKNESDFYLYRKYQRRRIKSILILELVFPKYDHDSGSQRLYHIIRILVLSGYHVILWAPFEPDTERYVRDFEKLNIELPYHESGIENYLERKGSHIDMVILSKKTTADIYLDIVMSLTDATIVLDTVDLHYLREERKASLLNTPFDQTSKSQELHCARSADEVLVVSPVEKKILEHEGLQKVSIVSNIHSLQPCSRSFAERSGLMFIGGFKHQPNIDGIIWFIEKIFPTIKKQIPDMHLDIVGSYPPASIVSQASACISVTGYIEDVSPYFEKARIFVGPLRFGAGVKGKIGQSMAYRLPVVTTSIGAEGMHLEDGISAMIADDEGSFAQKVIQLYHDQELWEVLSQNAGKIIGQYFSPEVVRKALLEMIEGDRGSRERT